MIVFEKDTVLITLRARACPGTLVERLKFGKNALELIELIITIDSTKLGHFCQKMEMFSFSRHAVVSKCSTLHARTWAPSLRQQIPADLEVLPPQFLNGNVTINTAQIVQVQCIFIIGVFFIRNVKNYDLERCGFSTCGKEQGRAVISVDNYQR